MNPLVSYLPYLLNRAGARIATAFGEEVRPLAACWDGLECYVAYDESLEPAELADRARTVLGREPDGRVDRLGLEDLPPA